jgi:hypothetical protein
VARFTIQSDNPAADIDMEVYGPDGELVAIGASSSGSETVTLFNPVAGLYQVVVYPFADAPGQPSTTYEYRAFAVGPDLPNFSVSPSSATVSAGVPRTMTASWTGLNPGIPYLGYVAYVDGTGTVVEIS